MAPLRGAEQNACRVWLAVDRQRKQGLDAVVGARDEAPGARLFAALARPSFPLVCPDFYRPLVPLPYRRKAETPSGERCHSVLRHYLARFRRRTKCDSKGKRRLSCYGAPR